MVAGTSLAETAAVLEGRWIKCPVVALMDSKNGEPAWPDILDEMIGVELMLDHEGATGGVWNALVVTPDGGYASSPLRSGTWAVSGGY